MSDLYARSAALKALYQRNRPDLKDVLRVWCHSIENAHKALEAAKKVDDQTKRGQHYLETVIDLLTMGEHTSTHFVAQEMAEAAKSLSLVKLATD